MRAARPNLLFVFPDQMQADAMGVAGHPTVQTPTLDELASQGLRCTRAIANCPLCTPSRATMLSGRYPLSHGAVTNWLPLPTDVPTFGDVLRDAGWRTGYIGKWHLNGAQRPAGFVPPGPLRHGFDYWAAFNDGHHYFDGVYYRDDPTPIPIAGYEPDGQTDLAIDFIRQHQEPWALFVSWGPPHQPYKDVPDEFKARYDEASVYVRPNAEGANRRIVADYYAAITALDADMGRLLSALDQTGQAERTLVVFTSDHGDMLFSHGLREKHQPYDESIRVPLLVRFPGVLTEGQVYDGLVTTADLLPTLLALLDCAAPPGVEGTDLAACWRAVTPESGPASGYILGPVPDHPRRTTVPWQEWRGIRTARYTYVASLHGPWLLFDNDDDPFQQRNLVAQPSAAPVLDDCQRELKRWLARTNDPFLPWRDLLRGKALQELWNARERVVHGGQEELL